MSTAKFDFSKKRILIAEDDRDLRDSIKHVLLLTNADVRVADNGLAAKLILEEGHHFDAVLSDIKMPEFDGIQLLSFCKEHYPKTKFLIFTGFSEYLETQSAADLGADGFLAKPFKLAEILGLLSEILGFENTPAPEDQSYCCVGVDEFYSTTKLPSDIFVKVGVSKFVKLAREGSEIELSRLEQIKDKKVKYLFVRSDDFHKYTGLSLRVAGAVQKTTLISQEKKMNLFKHTSEMLLQQAFVAGLDKEVCENAHAMLTNTLKAVSGNQDLLDVLVNMQTGDDELYNHSVLVSVYASMIAMKMGWTSQANQHKLTLAALFHEIGFKELPIELQKKPRFKMSQSDIRSYESHPLRGRDILNSIEGYPADLAAVVGQHHENANGTGYPQGLSASKIHPVAKLIRLADDLVDSLASFEKVDLPVITVVLTNLFANKREEIDLEMLAAAFELFKIVRPVGLKNKAA